MSTEYLMYIENSIIVCGIYAIYGLMESIFTVADYTLFDMFTEYLIITCGIGAIYGLMEGIFAVVDYTLFITFENVMIEIITTLYIIAINIVSGIFIGPFATIIYFLKN